MQAVSGREDTEWRWEIAGAREGKQTLHLTLSALISVDGDRTPRAIRVFDRTIDVQVTFRRRAEVFVEDNWQWLWAAIVVPVALLVWRRWKRRRDEKTEKYGWPTT